MSVRANAHEILKGGSELNADSIGVKQFCSLVLLSIAHLWGKK